MAPTGAVVNHSGSWAWLECATIRAIGLRPDFAAELARASSSADAPSAIDDEEAAVTVPSLANAGFRLGIFSMETLKGVSSRATKRSPLRSVILTGAISVSKAPDSTAASARRTDSAAKASCSARLNPYFAAVASAKQPISLPSHGL